jgi:hypothetical protein
MADYTNEQINPINRRGRFMTLLGNAKNREIYSETGGVLLSSEEYQPPFLLEKDVASLQSCISQQSHLSRPPPIYRPSVDVPKPP